MCGNLLTWPCCCCCCCIASDSRWNMHFTRKGGKAGRAGTNTNARCPQQQLRTERNCTLIDNTHQRYAYPSNIAPTHPSNKPLISLLKQCNKKSGGGVEHNTNDEQDQEIRPITYLPPSHRFDLLKCIQ